MTTSKSSFPSYEKRGRSQSKTAPNQVPTSVLREALKIMAEIDNNRQAVDGPVVDDRPDTGMRYWRKFCDLLIA